MGFLEYEIRIYDTTIENGIDSFIKKHHYSKSIARGCKHVFGLYLKGELVGAAQVGIPVGRNCEQKYTKTGKRVIELKRLALSDKCIKYTATWFIARIIKWIKMNRTDVESILSYADPNKGHTGTVYKAANFNYLGVQNTNNKVVRFGDKTYHVRTLLNGSVKHKKIVKLLKKKKLKYKKLEPKHIYLYNLDRK